MGVRSSWEASATNRRRRCSDSRRRSSEATRALKADSIRASMTLRVRARRPTSVVSFSPGHPLGQVAVGDRLGGRLHVAQGPQADADQPEPAEQGHDDRAAGHGQLDQQQVVERAPDVAQGLGHDQHVPVVEGRGPHPERRATGLGGRGGEVGDLGLVRSVVAKPVMVVGTAGV